MGTKHRPSRYRVRKADHRQRICHHSCPIHVLNLTSAADKDSKISNISSPTEVFDAHAHALRLALLYNEGFRQVHRLAHGYPASWCENLG